MGADERIEWSDALLTGVDEMDRQHRILVETVRELGAGRSGDPGARRFEVLTRDVLAYAIYHFETEERLMRQHGYDRARVQETATHTQQHREFSRRFVQLRDGLRGDEPEPRQALLSFLKDWLVDHLGTTDQLLARFIRSGSRA